MSVKESFLNIKNKLSDDVTLVAVSKTKPIEDIKAIYELGHKVFGENRVQEMVDKENALPKDIEWHFIGHLQRKKVKHIAPFVDLIHSVDSLKLLKEIDKRAKNENRKIKVLLQFHIAKEEAKYGFDIDIVNQFPKEVLDFENIEICGVMGMATFTDDNTIVKNEFITLKQTFDGLKQSYFENRPEFNVISMGMSGDFDLAIECGSNMVRIGSTIFGARDNK